MDSILKQINDTTSGSAIIVGGVAKWLNGYSEGYDKKWIDICIPIGSVESIKLLGEYLPLSEGTSFPLPIIDQFIMKVDNWIVDCFVINEDIEHSLIRGVNVITPKGDIDLHQSFYNNKPNEYTKKKIESNKVLYNIN